MNKLFLIIEIPHDDKDETLEIFKRAIFSDYDTATEYLARIFFEAKGEQLKISAKPEPVRIELTGCFLELWCCNAPMPEFLGI